MLPLLGHWAEVLFPGFTMTIFGAVGAIAGYRSGARGRELALLYGALAGLAFWTSLGPAGGLYSALYAVVPGFTFLRAAGRVGLIVTFSLAVLGGLGVSRVLTRFSVPNAIAAALTVFVIVESIEALSFRHVPPVSPAYQFLAAAPRGAVLELPVFSHQFKFLRVRYMLASTAHWQPLVNAYSDYIPTSFIEDEGVLGLFPSAESFELLKRDGVRYAVFHLNDYDRDQLAKLRPRLRCYRQYMRKLFADQHVLLYEIVGYP